MSKLIGCVLDVLNTSASYKEVLNIIEETINKINAIYPEFFKCSFDEVLSWEVSTFEENDRIDEFVITVDQINSRQRHISFPVKYLFMDDSELATVLMTERQKENGKQKMLEEFKIEVISKLGYNNLKPAMELFKKYAKING